MIIKSSIQETEPTPAQRLMVEEVLGAIEDVECNEALEVLIMAMVEFVDTATHQDHRAAVARGIASAIISNFEAEAT